MKALPVLATLLLSSSLCHADNYTGYVSGDGKKPKGACWEMICPNGCVENERGEGYCCSEGTSIVNTGDETNQRLCRCPAKTPKWYTTTSRCVECLTDKDCAGDSVCNPNKTCSCATGTTPYTKLDGTNSCCNTTTHVLSIITGTTNKSCCPNETPKWDMTTSNCVECLTDSDCPDGHTCNDKKCQKSCVKNVDWGKSCTDDCQCKDGTGKYSGWSGICQNNVCCFNECTFCGSTPYCPSVKYEKKLPKSVSFSVHNGGDKHTSCKEVHKVYVYVEALSTNKGTFEGILTLVETDTDDHRKYLKLNGQRFSKDTPYDYDVSLKPGEEKLVATYSDSDNFAKRASRGKITINKADLSGKFSEGTGEVKVKIKHSPSCSLSWVSDNEDGFGPNGGTYSY